MTTITLRPDGPHHDDTTAETARAFAEVVRTLNHATRGAGLTFPQTVYTMAGSLAAGAYGLGQLLDQIGAFLEREATAGRLADDSGADVRHVAARTRDRLDDARRAAAALAAALEAAQQSTSGLYVLDQHDHQDEDQGEGQGGGGW